MKLDKDFTEQLKVYFEKNNLMPIDKRDYDKWSRVYEIVTGCALKRDEEAK